MAKRKLKIFIRNKIGTSLPSTGLLGVYQWLTNHVTHLSSVRRDKEYENRFLPSFTLLTLQSRTMCAICFNTMTRIDPLWKTSFTDVKNFEVLVKFWNLAKYLQHPHLWMWKFQQNINYLWELLLPQCRPQLKSPVIYFTKSKRKGNDSSFFGSKKGFLFQYCFIFTCRIVLAGCE